MKTVFVLFDSLNRRVAVVNPGLGAPSAVMALGHAVRDGHRDFWFLGACGGLHRTLRIGDIVLVDPATSEEGTSPLYTRKGPKHSPDPIITDALGEAAREIGVSVRRGGILSTDAPYRESAAKIREYRSDGFLGVDMEVSALLAVARVRKVRIAGLLVVSDTLGEIWTVGWHWKAFTRGEDSARKVLLRTALGRKACSYAEWYIGVIGLGL